MRVRGRCEQWLLTEGKEGNEGDLERTTGELLATWRDLHRDRLIFPWRLPGAVLRLARVFFKKKERVREGNNAPSIHLRLLMRARTPHCIPETLFQDNSTEKPHEFSDLNGKGKPAITVRSSGSKSAPDGINLVRGGLRPRPPGFHGHFHEFRYRSRFAGIPQQAPRRNHHRRNGSACSRSRF